MSLALATGQPFADIIERWHGRDLDTALQLIEDLHTSAEQAQADREREARFAAATAALFERGR